MKITFIIATLGSGGAERVLVTLANEFCKEHEVEIIKFDQNQSFYELDARLKISTLPPFKFNNLYNKIASRFKKILSLRKHLKNSNADIFISFLDTTNIACIIAKIGLSTPLIISEHSTQSYLQSKFWRILRRVFYPKANALTVLNNNDKIYYEKFVKNVKVLFNPCSFSLQNREFSKENLVLFIGRLDANKNCAMFIKMIALLSEDIRKNYEFIVAGDGILRNDLMNLAKILNVNVKFLGKISDVKSLYERAKVLCLCSFIEGLPTVLIEAIFFDVCLISTDFQSGARDLIDDKIDGILVEKDNEKAMAKAVESVLRDDYLRLSLTQNAKKRCSHYDIKNIKKEWFNLISELKNA